MEYEEPTIEQMFEETSTEEQAVEQEAPQAPKEEAEPEYSYVALGKERKEPLSLILKRASQGFDYTDKQQLLKQQQAEIEAERARAQEILDRYGKIDEFARENPEWYDHWAQAYEQRQTYGQTQEQPQVDLSPIKSELDAIKQEFNGVKEFVTKQQQSQEDSKYWDELKSIQKEFPEVDFSSSDENGATLEYKVLQHARDNNIGSFRVAFRDYYHDNLKNRMYEQAKQELLKKDQENRKKGIVGVSNTPQLTSNMPDLRSLSENDILDAAIAEFNEME